MPKPTCAQGAPIKPSVPVYLGQIQSDLNHVRSSLPSGSTADCLVNIALQAVVGAIVAILPEASSELSATRNDKCPALTGLPLLPEEAQQTSVLLTVQQLASELGTQADIIDGFMADCSFEGKGVPAAFERAHVMMNTVRRLAMAIYSVAVDGLDREASEGGNAP
jgi:hypothetical protein